MTASRCLPLLLTALVAFAGVAPGQPARSVEDHARDHVATALSGGLVPDDFHHLLLALHWRSAWPDWHAVGPVLDRLGAAGADPLMQDEVRLWRARVAVEEGRDEAARAMFHASGGLERWWARGPIPLEELEDFPSRTTEPPRGGGWRPAQGTSPLGWTWLPGLAWPAQRQLLYLATTVASDLEQPVAVRVGAAQAARVWLNGSEILTTPQPLDQAEDQSAGGGWLRAGLNLVVIAVASENETWWLRARLTRPDGSPLEGVREVDSPPTDQPAVERAAPAVRTLEGEIRQGVAAGAPGARMALAAYLVSRRPDAAGHGSARAACQAARQEDPAGARILEWLLGGEPAAVQSLLEGALTADPELHPARIALGRWVFARGLRDRADTILAVARREPAVRATQLDLEAQQWGAVTLPEMEALLARAPRCVDALLALTASALENRRFELASRTLARLEALVPGLPQVTELGTRLATACGDGDALRDDLLSRLAGDPNRILVRGRLARLLASRGDADDARRLLADGLARCPDHPDLLLELARLEYANGNSDRAVELARQLLALRPQERRAERLLAHLGVTTTEETWRRTPEELWELASGVSSGPAAVILDHREVRFLPGNLTEERTQRAILITSAAQADDYLRHTVPHVPERQRLRVIAARILRRDGSQVSARLQDTPRLAEPELNLYYDTRLRVIRFPNLEDGDLIELCWVLSETAEANETGPYKGGIIRLAHPAPTLLAEVELSGPAAFLPAWELVHLSATPRRTEETDGTVRLSWRFQDLAPIPLDAPPAPPLVVTPHLVYSNHPDWVELGGWYARHVAPRTRASHQVKETAERLVSGLDERRLRVEAIARFVANEITYVGLELGEHRFRPFSADWVLGHRIGDCKDKAALLVALYESVGIPARMVLLRITDEGPFPARLAVLEAFNHAIVYLPEDDLLVDGTAAGHDPSLPPAMDQGSTALVVEATTSRLITTPVPGAGDERLHYRLRPGSGGTVELTLESSSTGEAADRRRAALAGTADPRRVSRWLQARFPGAELTSEPELSMPVGRDPATFRLEASLPRTALLAGGGIPLLPESLDLVAELTPVEGRQSPLLVTVRPVLEWTLEVDLGRPPRTPPQPVTLDGPLTTLRVEAVANGNGYRVDGSLRVASGLLSAGEAAALRELLVAVERALSRPQEVP